MISLEIKENRKKSKRKIKLKSKIIPFLIRTKNYLYNFTSIDKKKVREGKKFKNNHLFRIQTWPN